ncbi:MAG TPA: hypothetical protein VK815_04355 [Candidatus Acidoferrales bacterium]|jgi:hypothetical protein|nr:hypothetical protein [Candidatus Acidoferrales bacterium]
MNQTVQFKFKSESLPPKGKPTGKLMIGLAVNVLAVAVYFYVRYLTNMTHHKVMTAASRAVVAAVTSAGASSAATKAVKTDTSPVAVKSDAQPVVAAAAAPVAVTPSNSVPATVPSIGLGDSLMAVLSPSARAETVQAPMEPERAVAPAAVPAARQALKPANPARNSILYGDDDDDATLTDEQKLAKVVRIRFGNIINMAMKNPDVFGFGAGERVDLATLGEPIPVYSISEEDQRNYQAGQPLRPLLQATNEWIYPVRLNGRIRYMLPIKREGDQYVAEPGSRALALVYEKIEQHWPASKGFHPQLVVNPNMPNYYFTIPELDQQNLTDIGDMFQYHPRLSPATVILASWQ